MARSNWEGNQVVRMSCRCCDLCFRSVANQFANETNESARVHPGVLFITGWLMLIITARIVEILSLKFQAGFVCVAARGPKGVIKNVPDLWKPHYAGTFNSVCLPLLIADSEYHQSAIFGRFPAKPTFFSGKEKNN